MSAQLLPPASPWWNTCVVMPSNPQPFESSYYALDSAGYVARESLPTRRRQDFRRCSWHSPAPPNFHGSFTKEDIVTPKATTEKALLGRSQSDAPVYNHEQENDLNSYLYRRHDSESTMFDFERRQKQRQEQVLIVEDSRDNHGETAADTGIVGDSCTDYSQGSPSVAWSDQRITVPPSCSGHEQEDDHATKSSTGGTGFESMDRTEDSELLEKSGASLLDLRARHFRSRFSPFLSPTDEESYPITYPPSTETWTIRLVERETPGEQVEYQLYENKHPRAVMTLHRDELLHAIQSIVESTRDSSSLLFDLFTGSTRDAIQLSGSEILNRLMAQRN